MAEQKQTARQPSCTRAVSSGRNSRGHLCLSIPAPILVPTHIGSRLGTVSCSRTGTMPLKRALSHAHRTRCRSGSRCESARRCNSSYGPSGSVCRFLIRQRSQASRPASQANLDVRCRIGCGCGRGCLCRYQMDMQRLTHATSFCMDGPIRWRRRGDIQAEYLRASVEETLGDIPDMLWTRAVVVVFTIDVYLAEEDYSHPSSSSCSVALALGQ